MSPVHVSGGETDPCIPGVNQLHATHFVFYPAFMALSNRGDVPISSQLKTLMPLTPDQLSTLWRADYRSGAPNSKLAALFDVEPVIAPESAIRMLIGVRTICGTDSVVIALTPNCLLDLPAQYEGAPYTTDLRQLPREGRLRLPRPITLDERKRVIGQTVRVLSHAEGENFLRIDEIVPLNDHRSK